MDDHSLQAQEEQCMKCLPSYVCDSCDYGTSAILRFHSRTRNSGFFVLEVFEGFCSRINC